MKSRQELENIENLVKKTYNRRNNRVRENLTKPYDPNNPELGYSWKYCDPDTNTNIYNVVVAKLGEGELLEKTEYFIKMHEYGHIYLTHLDGIYEELDRNIANVFKNYRGQLIDQINDECGIDFAEELINRVIDDPALNHSLHNIAMDMEVNSSLLDKDCIELMEKGVTSIMPKIEEQMLEEMKGQAVDEETKKKIEEELEKMSKESKVKFILPCRYHLKDGSPFPDGLSYPEYVILIIKNLSQFVKMLVSINSGGNGDTSTVTTGQLQEAMKGGMGSLSDLMRQLGMIDEDADDSGEGEQAEGEDGPGKDANQLSKHDTSNSGGRKGSNEKKFSKHRGVRDSNYMELNGGMHKDHRTDQRDKADKLRKLGEISAGGGTGCSSGGGSFGIREVRYTDPVDEAIDEVMQRTKTRVIKRKVVRDIIRNYNLGKNRTVIAPSIIAKSRIDTKPKIVYLIDISGSMDTELIDRILSTISRKMKSINRGLSYDIITWNTRLGEHIKDIKAGEKVKQIRTGGGTRLREGIKYFKDNYGENAILIIASDFEDYLEEWASVMKTMPGYLIYGFNYGRGNYEQDWPKNCTIKNFNRSYRDY